MMNVFRVGSHIAAIVPDVAAIIANVTLFGGDLMPLLTGSREVAGLFIVTQFAPVLRDLPLVLLDVATIRANISAVVADILAIFMDVAAVVPNVPVVLCLVSLCAGEGAQAKGCGCD